MPSMESGQIQEVLKHYQACLEATVWSRHFRSFDDMWFQCPRVEWMLWALEAVSFDDERSLRLFAADCAERVLSSLPTARFQSPLRGTRDYANGRLRRQDLCMLRSATRKEANDFCETSGCSIAQVAALQSVLAAMRDRAIDAARDASRQALQSTAWHAGRSCDAEEYWQVSRLRELLSWTEVLEAVHRRIASDTHPVL